MSPARHASDAQLDAATWCRHLVPDRSVYAFLADHRHQLFPPEAFADLTRQGRGHPSVPAEVVASVLVLQALEGLSDREAASALRRDIAWKVACGLRLDDEGFHPTVLVYWRNRIRASDRPRRIFEAVRQVVEASGVLKGRGRRVLDSTILEDAVATQDTVTQLVAAIRRVRRLVPAVGEVELGAHDYDRPGKPDCDWDDPDAKRALVSGLVNDALAVLAAVQDVELGAEQAEAVALLALVAGQDVEAGERPGSWRIARRVARDRVISTVDPQARHTRKTSAHKRDGYKAHVAAEPESGLFTACALTAANAPDGPSGVELLDGEEPGLEVLGDSAYGSGETRTALRAAKHTQTIKPAPLTRAVPGGFTKHDFTIDSQAGTVACPAGYQTSITASGQASFGRRCQRCPLRQRCTTATGGRTIHVHPHEDELRATRRHATTRAFADSYRRWRPMVERSIAWLVADGCRRVPYHGIQRNHVWLSVRVAAVNLRRLLTLGLARRDHAWVLARPASPATDPNAIPAIASRHAVPTANHRTRTGTTSRSGSATFSRLLEEGQGLGSLRRHPSQEPASQLSPYRRDRTVVGEDRTGTCRATGNDRLPSRLPTVRTGGSARTRRSGGLQGSVRRMLLGGSRLGRWPILARAPDEDGLNSEKDNPQEPRPGD